MGVSNVFDRHGVFGTGVVTAPANADWLIDYTSMCFIPVELNNRFQ